MKHLTLLLFLCSTTLYGWSKTIEVTAKITDLTVYTSAVEVHNESEITLNKGKNSIIFTGLTPFIEDNTVNIAVNDPDVNILTVTEKFNYIKQGRPRTEQVGDLRDSIANMKERKFLIRCKSEALEAEKSRLFKDESIGGVSSGVSVEEIEKAAAFFQRRYYEINKELYALNVETKSLDARMQALENQIKQLTTAKSEKISEIRLIVNSPSQRKVKFNFKFLTAKGGWAPVYDFKYNGAKAPLDFVFRANVFNASGVPWNDVNIKLSTADPIRGFNLPNLQGNGRPNAEPVVQGNNRVDFHNVRVSTVIAEYPIKHKYTVPSDAKPYLVEVDAYQMPSNYSYLLIPKLDPFGFLMAKIPNWNQYNLIPGQTNIYNNGTYMGKTFLQTYAPNDTLSVYLGKDQSVQAMRKEEHKHHPRNIVGNFAIDRTWVEVVIKNNGDSEIPIEVLDQVPVAPSNNKVKLTVDGVEDADYDAKEGLLTWRTTLAPGQSYEIKFEYELKAPKEQHQQLKSYRKSFRTIACPSF